MKKQYPNLSIQDSSGEYLNVPLRATITLGRDSSCDVRLKDPQVGAQRLVLLPSGVDKWWFKSLATETAVQLNGLRVTEGELPYFSKIKIGETTLQLLPANLDNPLPETPRGLKKWQTVSDSGRVALWNSRKTASTGLSIYLHGETGTGKEVLAHLIHAWSPRAAGPFVPLHCGALPLSLVESELFGHVKGAFTGAVAHRPGALLQAHGGTLFLDEVGDLPMDIQVKLLRFLEDGEIRPVGADRTTRADVRILCATHHSLEQLVEKGKFRQDLFYRIASVTIEIPSLRERPADIEFLAVKFASELKKTLSPPALNRLKAYEWPGNVRELRHAIERASGMSGPERELLTDEDFQFLVEFNRRAMATEMLSPLSGIVTLAEMERLMLTKALRTNNGNRSKAAKSLGIARSTLFEMLRRYEIKGPRMI